MKEREERLYFAVHGLEPITAEQLNAELEEASARHRRLLEGLDPIIEDGDSRRGRCDGDIEPDDQGS